MVALNTSGDRTRGTVKAHGATRIVPIVLAMAGGAPAAHAQAVVQRPEPSGELASAAIPVRQSDDALRSLLEQRILDRRGLGFGVALLEPDGSTRYLSVGQSGQTGRPQVDPDTIFEIGSVTKVFTGTLLAQMAERGEVRLSDTVRALAPKEADLAAGGVGDISLRQLVTHTSGLPRLPLSADFLLSMAKGGDNPYLHYTTGMMWTYLAQRRHDATKAYPFDYSNLGVGLLGELLASRTGMSYLELVDRRILAPLGMRDTHVDVPVSKASRFARGHTELMAPTGHWDLPAMGAAGALRSTPRDMAAFMRAQMTGSLAGARSAQMPLERESQGRQVGHAWMVTSSGGDEIIWHNGGTGGFRSFVGFSTRSGRGVVVLANAAVAVDDIAMHSLNTRFPIDHEAVPTAGRVKVYLSLAVAAMAWLWAAVTPFRAMYDPAPEGEARMPRWLFKRQRIASRFDAAWGALEIVVVAALVAMFAPWPLLGPFALTGKVVLGIGSLLAGAVCLYRARKLPWQGRFAARPVTWMSRAVTSLLALALLAVWLSASA